MPWKVEKRGNKWVTVNEDTGKVKGTHDSQEKAQSQLRLLNAVKHGWKPTHNR